MRGKGIEEDQLTVADWSVLEENTKGGSSSRHQSLTKSRLRLEISRSEPGRQKPKYFGVEDYRGRKRRGRLIIGRNSVKSRS